MIKNFCRIAAAAMLAAFTIDGSTPLMAQDFSQVDLTWTPATNQLTGSVYQVWVGQASHAYAGHWPAATNAFTLTTGMLSQGMNYIAVTQISTNDAGDIDVTAFSGEVQIQQIPQAIVTPQVTNMELLVSTDLGRSWSTTGTNAVTVPVSEAAQQFYRARASFMVSITRTNFLNIMPGP